MEDLTTRSTIATVGLEGNPMISRIIDDGRCEPTIVIMGPRRFDIDVAMRAEIADTILVTKNREPRTPSLMAKLLMK